MNNGDNRIRTLTGSSIYRSCAQDGPEASMSDGGVTCSFVRDLADRMSGAAQREIFTLPVDAARLKAREIIDQSPRSSYLPIVENWRQLSDGKIELTMRRLPAAD